VSLADDAALHANRQALKERNAEAQKSHYDDRTGRTAIFATNCLGCGCQEGGFHGKTCPWREEPVPPKLLRLDVKKLIESYGLRPRWATMDRDGFITIAGHSKEA
jgi:hypothetical protein